MVASGLAVREAAEVASLVRQNDKIKRESQILQPQIQENASKSKSVVERISNVSKIGGGSEDLNDLVELRNEATRLRKDSAELARLKSGQVPESGEMVEVWVGKVRLLKKYLNDHPQFIIPELNFVNERAWLIALDPGSPVWALEKEEHYKQAVRNLLSQAQMAFDSKISDGLTAYWKANSKHHPGKLKDLESYFPPQVSAVLAENYLSNEDSEMAASVLDTQRTTSWVLKRKSPYLSYRSITIVPVKDRFDFQLASSLLY